MIPWRYILEWRQFAPWPEDAQVEQDLIIEKALAELEQKQFLKPQFPILASPNQKLGSSYWEAFSAQVIALGNLQLERETSLFKE